MFLYSVYGSEAVIEIDLLMIWVYNQLGGTQNVYKVYHQKIFLCLHHVMSHLAINKIQI